METFRKSRQGAQTHLAETLNLSHLVVLIGVLGSSQLLALVPDETREKYSSGEAPKDKALVLDLLSLGYAKLLGKGRLPSIPMVVKARYASKEAERKINENGGAIELVA